MKVLLMRPLERREDTHVLLSANEHPDLGLGWLASAARNGGHEAQILNGLDRIGDEEFIEILKTSAPSVVGFKIFVDAVGEAVHTIGLVRKALPDATVIVGGHQPTGDAKRVLSYIPADYAFAGEGEIGFPMFLDAVEENRHMTDEVKATIPGLIWKNVDDAVVCNEVARVDDVDTIGWPAWDLIPPNEFSPPMWIVTKARIVAPVAWSRGCRSHCTFCASYLSSGRTPRERSTESIVAEARMLKEKYGVGELLVTDDNFGHSEEFVIDVCKALYNSGLNLIFQCMAGIRLSRVSEKMAYWLNKAGCHDVHVGIESGSDRILKMIKKGLTVDIVERKVKILHAAGVTVSGFFVMGFPTETEEEMKATFDLARRINLVRACFHLYNPLPGTAMFQSLVDEGHKEMEEVNWDNTGYFHYESNFSAVPVKRLRRIQMNYYWRYHLRGKVIRHLFRSANLRHQLTHTGRLLMRYTFGR